MPALPFLALALAMILPRPAAWACLVIQAVTCWPQVIDLYDPSAVWRLREFPLSSALRIEREPEYLWRKLDEFKIARMVETDAVPGEKIFALMAAPKAYLDREVLESWHSAQADQLAGTLLVAGRHLNEPLYDLEAVWPAQLLRGLRFRLTARHAGEWCIHEVRLYSGNDQLYNSPQWLLRAWPNPWEVPVAFDDNLATYWRTWETMRPGMYLEVDLDRPQALTSALLVSTPVYGVPVEFFGLSVAGQWRLLSNRPRAQLREREDLRKPAVQALKRAGFRYILVPASDQGYGPLGKTMVGHEAEWGIEPAGQAGKIYLFRIP